MTTTIIGQVIDQVGHSARREGLALRGWFTDAAELRHRQASEIPLTADHGEEIGSVLYLGRTAGGVYAVAVTDHDQLADFGQPVYYSATTDCRASDGGDGVILELALTAATARVAAQPVQTIAGDIRSSLDRGKWTPRHDLVGRLLAATVEEIKFRRPGHPTYLRALGRPRPDRPVDTTLRALGRPRLERSQHTGRIISVR